ncbi:class I SAM-dependent methyltransferase [Pseudoruegeria sp. HB172150]|uniref:class I SAM-dependent methyltransferase n=1 Tax=Pseudoruegeria sp. HB172150 TaxID=2721164 RepID=UPI001551A6C4|nr:class I SAM-dependent methyltransferase [Pseudoruegeria sp. HB172150]
MDTVELKPERFDTTVDNYITGRVRYAPALIRWLAEDTGTAGQTVLDLGCGPGFIANAIAPFAAKVIGFDPSPNMIAAATADAAPNAKFAVGSSETLDQLETPLQLVTMGRSFHWMDRPQTLRDLDRLLAPGGAIALLGDSPVKGPATRWLAAANEVGRGFAQRDEYDEFRVSDDWQPHEEVLSASAFSDLRQIAVHETETWDFPRLLAFFLSRSGTTEARLGARSAEMKAALRSALEPFGPGPWTSLHRHSALIARRPG